MSQEPASNNRPRLVITLSKDIVPVWNIIATCIMLAASITTCIVFSADSGRYVPTGSVLGFQGPSYFFITGLWGLVVGICWGFATAAKLKRVSLQVLDAGTLLLNERVIGGSRDARFSPGDLKGLLIKRYPSAGHVAWLIIALGWFAFILQLAIPNFFLPFAAFPTTGVTLLVFGGSMVVTAVIGVARPGLHLVLVDAACSRVIKMPGITSPRVVISKLEDFARDARLMPSGSNVPSDLIERERRRQVIVVVGAIYFVVFGIANIILLLAGSVISVLNQGSSWAIIVAGLVSILSRMNHGNGLPANSWHASVPAPIPARTRHSTRLWIACTCITGSILLWYFVGISMRFGLGVPGYHVSQTLLLVLNGVAFTSWSVVSCTGISRPVTMCLGSQDIMCINEFSTTICNTSKPVRRASLQGAWPLAIMIGFFTLVALAFSSSGFLSFQ